MLHTYYFSASGTTGKIVKTIADNLGSEAVHHNLTPASVTETVNPEDEDIALFAAPVYAGRIPSIAAEKFKRIRGNGQKCISIVIYGNRHYDDALLELSDLLKSNGFDVVAAAAFVARHSIFPKVAESRPDADDLEKIREFSSAVSDLLSEGSSLDIDTVYGNRPYKEAMPIPLYPKVNKSKCGECGKCARECPTGAIDIDNPKETDTEKCISCSRCIVVCPDNARYFGGLKYKAIAPIFAKKCAARRDPEWFLAKIK